MSECCLTVDTSAVTAQRQSETTSMAVHFRLCQRMWVVFWDISGRKWGRRSRYSQNDLKIKTHKRLKNERFLISTRQNNVRIFGIRHIRHTLAVISVFDFFFFFFFQKRLKFSARKSLLRQSQTSPKPNHDRNDRDSPFYFSHSPLAACAYDAAREITPAGGVGTRCKVTERLRQCCRYEAVVAADRLSRY